MLTIMSGNVKDIEFENAIMFPESGKHPDEHLKIAQDLILKSKNENITIVTYSPILVEGAKAIGQFLEIPINFYFCEGGEKHLCNDNMYVIFRNLGNAFEKISNVEIENDFGLCIEKTVENLNKLLEDD
ncbi:MAG: hypothetical protein IKF82_00315 [Bacilli bacterium]|nr:hypothetical protein [Bacilli bacterium]